MKTMKEIAELAERKIDSMNALPKQEALKMDYVTAVDVLLHAVGLEYCDDDVPEIDGITPEYKYNAVILLEGCKTCAYGRANNAWCAACDTTEEVERLKDSLKCG